MKIIDADELRKTMYHEAFETDTDMQKWESGCWIRYKMFENALENAPTIDIDSIIAEHENIGYEKGIRDGYAKAVDVEPIRHGHWIECESENGIHFHKCSECGNRDMYQGTFTDWGGRGFSFCFQRHFCPMCGARMKVK